MRLIGILRGESMGDQLGNNCKGMGDINSDGFNDFLVAVRGRSELRLYLGGPHPFLSPAAVTWHGIPPYGNGEKCALFNVGDVDCDGVNDFICGFGPYSTDTLKLITKFKGLSTGQEYILHIDNGGFSALAAGGGDNDHDGRPEFWVYWRSSIDSLIHGYSGCDLLDSVPRFVITASAGPANNYHALGRKIITTCDLNGDSIPDIIFGQPSDSPEHLGRICIVWGGLNLSSNPDLTLYAPSLNSQGNQFGTDLACLGDISGDGIDDLWVSQGTRNYIYFGGRPFDTIPDITIDWPNMYADVENVGDINHDGWNDVMLVESSDLFSYISYIYCYPGMDTLVDVVYRDNDFESQLPGVATFQIGRDHSWAGDIDGDGIDDILISLRDAGGDAGTMGVQLVQAGWNGQPVDVTNQTNNPTLTELELKQNTPNPFNSSTTIDFFLRRSGYTELKIYNLLGQLIAMPVHQVFAAGDHRVEWDSEDLDGNLTPTGIYFYKLSSGNFSDTRKMILLK